MNRLLNYFTSFDLPEEYKYREEEKNATSEPTVVVNNYHSTPWWALRYGGGSFYDSRSPKHNSGDNRAIDFLCLLVAALLSVWTFAVDEFVIFCIKDIDGLATREMVNLPDLYQLYREWRSYALFRMRTCAFGKAVLCASIVTAAVWGLNFLTEMGILFGSAVWLWMVLVGRTDEEVETCYILSRVIRDHTTSHVFQE